MQYGSTILWYTAFHYFSGTADIYYDQALIHQAEGKRYSEPRDTSLTTEQLPCTASLKVDITLLD